MKKMAVNKELNYIGESYIKTHKVTIRKGFEAVV